MMDTATASPTLGPQSLTDIALTADPRRTVSVSATYLLSEEGRKASLLIGGNGRAVQDRNGFDIGPAHVGAYP